MVRSYRQQRCCTMVRIQGITYKSITEAVCALTVCHNTVVSRCHSKDVKWKDWIIVLKAPVKNYPFPKKVEIDGIVYPSISEAAVSLKMPRSSLRYYCARNQIHQGRLFRFATMNRDGVITGEST